jgi:predicted phage tail protein
MKINLHGKLGEEIGESWDLEVSSVAEALRGIEANTKKLRKWFLDHVEDYEYDILVNKKSFLTKNLSDNLSQDEIYNSELFLNIENHVEYVDIVPVIKGSAFMLALGALFFAGGIAMATITTFVTVGMTLAFVGLGLMSMGVSSLLSKPPPSVPYTAQQVNPIEGGGGESGGPASYLFNGPTNTVGEGGPVPIGYGELTVGGHTIFSNYEILYRIYKQDWVDATLQASIFGTERYLLNSRGFLASQEPILAEP